MKIHSVNKILIFIWCLTLSGSIAQATELNPLLQVLNTDNHFAFVRHALAPGNGDPSNFSIDDCETQRNLNETGRAQSIHMGQMLRNNGINHAAVFTSEWCRCQDTARLLDFDDVESNPFLNSFYRERDKTQGQTLKLEKWLLNRPMTTPLILVSHQVNITAFTDIYPSSGDMVVIKRNEDKSFTVLGVVSTQL